MLAASEHIADQEEVRAFSIRSCSWLEPRDDSLAHLLQQKCSYFKGADYSFPVFPLHPVMWNANVKAGALAAILDHVYCFGEGLVYKGFMNLDCLFLDSFYIEK